MITASNVINQQDAILNQLLKNNVLAIIHLVNGFQLRGFVRGFDSFIIILEYEGKQQLVYKHAISTVTPQRPLNTLKKEVAVE